mgnify:CR=1 FL=1|tara:strand:- start:26032 stop:26784 length:753 start_codon:yes stop_codon:yes gene_type:complete
MNYILQNQVLKNFDNAALCYNKHAEIQKHIAKRLATICSNHSIPRGLWVDLGSGTGLLAQSLEANNPGQQVVRIDISKNMLTQHPTTSLTKAWDLNQGLPKWKESPKLLASNFVLHWLNAPTIRLQEWLNSIAYDGWIALALPIEGSFPEWYNAAKSAQVHCSAVKFPSQNELLTSFMPKQIKYKKVVTVTQNFSGVGPLFKSMIKIGAQSSSQPSLKISEWKRLQKAWIGLNKNEIALTWLIQILLIKK